MDSSFWSDLSIGDYISSGDSKLIPERFKRRFFIAASYFFDVFLHFSCLLTFFLHKALKNPDKIL